jgi:DNA adenine methylase
VVRQEAYGTSEVVTVEVAKIRENPLNRRIYNKNEDPAFLQSIRERGILEPLVLNERYTLVSGSRRLEAARKLKLKAVPALLRKFSNESIALVEFNRYRQKTPLEIFREAQVLRQEVKTDRQNGKVEGDTRAIVADKLGVSEGYLQMLEIVAGSKRQDLIQRVDSGVVGVSQAYRFLTGNGKASGDLVSLGRYYSGKQAMTPKLVSLVSQIEHRCYVEPFGGFCSVLLNKPPDDVEVYNDVSKDVANFLLCLRNDPLTVVSEIESLPYSRWLFGRLIDEIKGAECQPLDPHRAAKWWALNWMCFSGLHERLYETNWTHSANRNPAIQMNGTADRLFYAAARLQNVQVENADFRKVFELYDGPDTLFFVDPPYFQQEGALGVTLSEQDHKDLRDLLFRAQGKWILTYNDDRQVRTLYKGCKIEEVVSEVSVKAPGSKADYWKQLIITRKR